MGVKHYDKQFKERAVKLNIQRGNIGQVAQEVGASDSQLSKWRKNFEQFGSNSFPGRGIERMTDEHTTIAALKMALKRRAINSEGLLFHSDRGVQYTSQSFVKLLKVNNITQSMSHKENCWDNAVAESFFKTLKAEIIYNTALLAAKKPSNQLFIQI